MGFDLFASFDLYEFGVVKVIKFARCMATTSRERNP